MKTLIQFAAALVIYMLLDLAFINVFAKAFIQRQLGDRLAEQPDLAAAAVFYLVFIAGLLYFCVWPASSAADAAFKGAFLGLIAYGTYELVNKALLAGWPLALVLVDMAWGVFVGAAVSWAAFMVGTRLAR